MYIVDYFKNGNAVDRLYKITAIQYNGDFISISEGIKLINKRHHIVYKLQHLKYEWYSSYGYCSYKTFLKKIGSTKQKALLNYIKLMEYNQRYWDLDEDDLKKINRYKKILAKYFPEEKL